jgi:Domain of unknown function (DUF4279)
MREQNEQYAYFSLHGDFDPAQITQHVGVEPTASWKKGDRTRDRDHVRIFSRWTMESTLARSAELDEHIDNVLAQLDANESVIRDVALKHSGTLQLVGYFWQNFPGLHFRSDIVTRLARYGLAVDFDFYGLYSHRREDTGFTYMPDP